MNLINRIEEWGNAHRPGFLDFFRILLGIYITYKGGAFATNLDSLQLTVQGMNMAFAGAVLAHYVIFAHLLGGPLIVFGVVTRIMCLIQMPILIGAVFLVNAPKGFMAVGNHMELEISLIVLALLLTFVVFGAGKWSIDEKRRQEKLREQSTAGNI